MKSEISTNNKVFGTRIVAEFWDFEVEIEDTVVEEEAEEEKDDDEVESVDCLIVEDVATEDVATKDVATDDDTPLVDEITDVKKL